MFVSGMVCIICAIASDGAPVAVCGKLTVVDPDGRAQTFGDPVRFAAGERNVDGRELESSKRDRTFQLIVRPDLFAAARAAFEEIWGEPIELSMAAPPEWLERERASRMSPKDLPPLPPLDKLEAVENSAAPNSSMRK